MDVSHKCYIHPHITETWTDYPDAHSNAISVFFYGCEHNCLDCHNKEMQSIVSPAIPVYAEDLERLIRHEAARHKTDKIVLSGGDPLHPNNRDEVVFLCYRLNSLGYKVCLYTGYGVKVVKCLIEEGVLSFVKCGKFDINLAQASGKGEDFFSLASSNQVLYDGFYRPLTKDGYLYFNKGD